MFPPVNYELLIKTKSVAQTDQQLKLKIYNLASIQVLLVNRNYDAYFRCRLAKTVSKCNPWLAFSKTTSLAVNVSCNCVVIAAFCSIS